MNKRDAPLSSGDSSRRRKRAKLTTTTLELHEDNRPAEQTRANNDQDLVFEISHLFEYEPRRDVKEVCYAVKCGPVIVRRRRRDAEIEIRPVLKLARMLYGSDLQHTGLRELADRAEDAEITSVLTRSYARQTVSADQLSRSIEGTDLANCLSTILDERLPIKHNDEPIVLPPKAGVVDVNQICRYCGTSFEAKELGRHHRQHRGLCQLHNPAGARGYSEMFQKHLVDALDGLQTTCVDLPESSHRVSSYATTQCLGGSVWTDEELDALYRGLRRYSKWQVELISAQIPGKSTSDVLATVHALDEAAKHIPRSRMTLRGVPCARESSDRLVQAEEQLAEDMVVWEAFAQQASRTPRDKRDRAEKACATTPGLEVACSTCRAGTICNGTWPVCNGCTSKDVACIWPADFHPSKCGALLAPRHVDLRPMLPLIRNDTRTIRRREIKTEAMSSISWAQLVGLGNKRDAMQQNLHWLWLEATQQEADLLRNFISTTLAQNGMNAMPSQRKEAIYAAVMQHSQEPAEADTTPKAEIILSLAQAHAHIHEMRQPLKSHKEKRMRAWTEIPLSLADLPDEASSESDMLFAPELEQGRNQIYALGLNRDDLGEAGKLFNVRSIGIRLRSEGVSIDQTDTGIALNTLQDLHTKLLAYLRSVVATAVCIVEMGEEPIISKSALLRAIGMTTAATQATWLPRVDTGKPTMWGDASPFQPDLVVLLGAFTHSRADDLSHYEDSTIVCNHDESDGEVSDDESDLLEEMLEEDHRIDQEDSLDDLAEEVLYWQRIGITNAAFVDGSARINDMWLAEADATLTEDRAPSDNDTTDAQDQDMASPEPVTEQPTRHSSGKGQQNKATARFRTSEFVSSSEDESDA